ncbi:MAG: NarK/NasA family nitrate transporter [Candidatus Eremiobacteraeota bacterium]|nr:NarK/NasA family nitrate transporter [Candidatus Eremiobacteraeota bacterium]MCW5869882.1 NarK/NasA family nitrate transporter [Candidatus Eremiobacteraeota bacterium]
MLSRPNAQLLLATVGFALCFAVFGSISAMMPILKKQLQLSPLQASLAVATPVLLGSLGRIPLGWLADRYGGRKIFSLVMLASVVPAVAMAWVKTFPQLLLCGFFAGIALAVFSVGVGFVSRWYPPDRQGTPLGIYGAGNVGQSLAAYGSPLLVGALGYAWGFWMFALLLAVWMVIFILFARDAERRAPAPTLAQMLAPARNPQALRLSLYYFLTFGGFVALAGYLPIFLTEWFNLSARDAGMRTAGFIMLATGLRPLGGWLADKLGGNTVLRAIFPFLSACALLMSLPHLLPFTLGALMMAAGIGMGNGAVFKLVPEHFPHSVGTVTGFVGAAGGLGGFFPPLLVGGVYQLTGTFSPAFLLLAGVSLVCYWQAAASGDSNLRDR